MALQALKTGMLQVTCKINGKEYTGMAEPRTLLVHFLRDDLNLTGTHIGCDTGHCGACTIMFNGKALKSCMLLAVQAQGAEILTVEGLAQGDKLHPIQEAFWENHGLQCGYCTPGMLIAGLFLLQRNPDPTEEEIRRGIESTIITGYSDSKISVTFKNVLKRWKNRSFRREADSTEVAR